MIPVEQYNVREISFDTVSAMRNKKKITYINIECGFDIESSSVLLDGETKAAFMYEWTFGIKDKNFICYGRTWEEFISLCAQLQEYFQLGEDRHLICYIHNFAFEFQFMRKWFQWESVFSVKDRKPIKAVCSYGIEFRDSLILSGYSLAKTAENLQFHKVEKLIGELDYSLIHTSDTVLTKEELEYCENDVLIILYYINEQIAQYGDISKIPLTNTGRVRKYVRDCCYHSNSNHKNESKRKFAQYRDLMNRLTVEPDEYMMLVRAFQGGFTHANANYSGKLLENVASVDFTSSYPAVMLSERFPMSKGEKVALQDVAKERNCSMKEAFEFLIQNYCLVFDVCFEGLRSKIGYENYISESKCSTLEGMVLNNGRVYSAKKLVTTITEIDFKIIRKCYEWDKIGVQNIILYKKGYLPKDIILAILDLYEKKTTLKGVEGKEVEYTLSKGMLNSVYGMCVTSVVRDEIIYTDKWSTEKANVQEQINNYNSSFTRFLFYPWGVWVTAYARMNLWGGILNVGNDYVYSDTDSIKLLNYEKHLPYIEAYNNMVTKKLMGMCEFYGINPERLKPRTIKGVEKPIGVWDYEGTYSRFKTLGAKRYMVEDRGQLHITIAGLSKQDGVKYMSEVTGGDNTATFQMFNNNLYIPADRTGKMTHTYIDEEYEFDVTDYQGNVSHVYTKSGVHLENCEFTLSISRQYATFIGMLLKGYIYGGVRDYG